MRTSPHAARPPSDTIGVILPEFSEGYTPHMMLGFEQYLLQKHYPPLHGQPPLPPTLIEEYPLLLTDRLIDGMLLVTRIRHKLRIPIVGISSHSKIPGVKTSGSATHTPPTWPRHLHELCHRRFAFMKGGPSSS